MWRPLHRSTEARWAATLRSALEAIRQRGVEFERDNVKLAEQNRRLRQALAKHLDMSAESPAFQGGLGGRTAVEQYRNTNIGKFIQHVNEAGAFALSQGAPAAEFVLRTVVKADLECLFAAPPVTVEEGMRRAHCEWMLSSAAPLSALSGTEEWHEAARLDFISDVLSAGVDTSTWELIRRSGETSGRFTPRADDEE